MCGARLRIIPWVAQERHGLPGHRAMARAPRLVSLLALSKGLSCFDQTNVIHFNVLYHLPTVKTERILSSVVNGWWVGSIVSLDSGQPYTPVMSTNRSLSGNRGTQGDSVNIVTSASSPQIKVGGVLTTYNFVPFNPSTVNTGNPSNWYNPLMFQLEPVGFLGNAARGLLRGPALRNWDFFP